ncbi:NUDIX hydrolase [Streptomyces sp. G-G2]|uniref:NUDIX domain-containing protein n=1 Tax=Streptomyces sp. G-G2 TaxID=3046201 RepID=UPI0024B948FD|nr:NUDIX hydrolase [Streptomyces sp. G-G2]MDJ0383093.1 NUDIX hydrolase [Streptomyces sp. G-G2]
MPQLTDTDHTGQPGHADQADRPVQADLAGTAGPAAPEERPVAAAGTWMTPAEYGASRATLWSAACVLITDADGRVLVQTVDYRPDRLLPGGAVDAGEAPSAAAAREVYEELGIRGHYPRGLAVDWIPADAPGYEPEMRFPGEILHVFDGGTWSGERIAAIRLPGQEITGVQFAEPADLPCLMHPGDARRALCALRARIDGGGPALLEDGRPTAPGALDRLGVLRTPRAPQRGTWHGGPAPESLPVHDRAAWLFAPDGRVLVLIARDTGAVRLPEPAPGPLISESRPLGHLREAEGVRIRSAARLRALGPAGAAGPGCAEPGYARVLATPEQVRDLSDWGPAAEDQLAAVHTARARLGLPPAPRRPVTELPAEGVTW